jgi:bleomycin hydrolase
MITYIYLNNDLQIEAEGKPVTNQKNSGRCWIFAALNVMRIPFIKHFNIEDFEFSQGHLFFYDKVSSVV